MIPEVNIDANWEAYFFNRRTGWVVCYHGDTVFEK